MASVSNITNSIAYVEPGNSQVLNINSGLPTDHRDHFKAPGSVIALLLIWKQRL